MTKKPYRLAAAALALLATAPLLSACKDVDQALDCGNRAVSIAGDVQDLAGSAINVGQLTDQERRKHTADALKKVGDDIKKLRDNNSGDKIDKATDKLNKAVTNAQDNVSKGKLPDIGAITDAAGDVTKACAGS
ncbi:polyhydroxyalkanoate synthesis regulator phasin [Kitasatospora sp. MAA19]|uniref:hypothetical protein n=1 Tax=unclassified Kitasatospora TaxID=2633591 RepID=UPI002476EC19|nr:hypothetical protein [Kitasatospora sp. MAA19]MDH6706544.1 polyhydroxyalkanoate synthesis regulator phasin [Kitasatospora sp. MAA19]